MVHLGYFINPQVINNFVVSPVDNDKSSDQEEFTFMFLKAFSQLVMEACCSNSLTFSDGKVIVTLNKRNIRDRMLKLICSDFAEHYIFRASADFFDLWSLYGFYNVRLPEFMIQRISTSGFSVSFDEKDNILLSFPAI
jgi:hypothetical protein